MRFGNSVRPTSTAIGACALLLAAGCAPTAPLLLEQAPPRAASFSLRDSAEVVRRVQQVFSCAAGRSAQPLGTLGWRRDSTFVDVTVMQDVASTGPASAPDQMCYKGFRVDAEGKIFALPERDWPYTAFRKSRSKLIPT